MKNMIKKTDKKAFTLIELIVVVAVVGILVLLGTPRFIGYTQRAELARIQHDTKVMEQEIVTMLINKDDDFNKWENSSEDFNQLIQENKLFDKEGPVEKVESADKTYKIIPEEFSKKINTKLKGTFYADSDGKVYYEHVKPLFGKTTGAESPDPEEPGEPGEPGEKEPGIPVNPEPGKPGEKEPVYSDKKIQGLIDEGYIPIATAEELDNIFRTSQRTYGEGTDWEKEYTGGLGKQYVQVANLDLSGYSEKGWTPIGTYPSGTRFTGTYDGGNYVITGLVVDSELNNYPNNQGLFKWTEGATIRNVALEDINVTGSSNVGGLVGSARSSTIENSYAIGGSVKASYGQAGGLVGEAQLGTEIINSYATVSVEGNSAYSYAGGLVGEARDSSIKDSYATGSVTGSGYYLGGLAGSARSSTIINSYATGSVEGTDRYAGGLVGRTNYSTTISNSYSTGSVKGTEDVGGLVGYADSSIIENSYAKGPVTGNSRVGGLVGYAVDSTTNISNSYATGPVIGQSKVGGLVGSLWDNPTISNSYWNIETTEQPTSDGGTGKTTDEMMKADTYSAWDTDVWNIVNGDYPKLR